MLLSVFPQPPLRYTPRAGRLIEAVDYLFRVRDAAKKQRPYPPLLLRGNPCLLSNLVCRSGSRQPYCAGVLAFTEAFEAFSTRKLEVIMDLFEEAFFPGAHPRDRMVLWVLHRTRYGFELHFVALGQDLNTGHVRSPIVADRDRTRLRLLVSYVNTRLGLSSPWEPSRICGFETPKRLCKTKKGERYQSVFLIADAMVRCGQATSRKDLIDYLPENGIEVLAVTPKSLRVRLGKKEPFSAQGWIFTEAFDSIESLKRQRVRLEEQWKDWKNPAWLWPRLLDRTTRRLSSTLMQAGAEEQLLPARVKNEETLASELTFDPHVLTDPKIHTATKQYFPALNKLHEESHHDGTPSIPPQSSADALQPNREAAGRGNDPEPSRRDSSAPVGSERLGGAAILFRELRGLLHRAAKALRRIGKSHSGIERKVSKPRTDLLEARRLVEDFRRECERYGGVSEGLRRDALLLEATAKRLDSTKDLIVRAMLSVPDFFALLRKAGLMAPTPSRRPKYPPPQPAVGYGEPG